MQAIAWHPRGMQPDGQAASEPSPWTSPAAAFRWDDGQWAAETSASRTTRLVVLAVVVGLFALVLALLAVSLLVFGPVVVDLYRVFH